MAALIAAVVAATGAATGAARANPVAAPFVVARAGAGSEAQGPAGVVTVRGTVPTGPEAAPVWPLTRRATMAEVSRLAHALGLPEPVLRQEPGTQRESPGASSTVAAAWTATADDRMLTVSDGPGNPWWYVRAASTSCLSTPGASPDAPVSCTVSAQPMPEEATPGPDHVQAPDPAEALAAASPVLEALAAASPVLEALPARPMVTASPSEVAPAGPGAVVTSRRSVAGLPADGLETVIEVDAEGVVSARGWLGGITQGDTHPVVTAQQAIDRWTGDRWTMDRGAADDRGTAGACPNPGQWRDLRPGQWPTTCQAPRYEVRDARLGLMMAFAADRPLLVPAWHVDLIGPEGPVTVVLSADEAAQPGPPPGAAEPGVPGQPPQSPQPMPPGPEPAPRPTGTGLATIESAVLSGDGMSLQVRVWGPPDDAGPCGATLAVRARETPDEVEVTARFIPTENPAGAEGIACPAIAAERTGIVQLTSPLAGRPVVDRATGKPVPLSTPATSR